MRGAMMMMGRGDVAPAQIVENLGARPSWRPDTGLAKQGDLAIALCQSIGGSGWSSATNFRYRFLSAGDMTTTFNMSSGRYFEVLVLRNVRAIVQRLHTDSTTDPLTLSGFTPDSDNCGVLLSSDVAPDPGGNTVHASVGGISVPVTTDYYSPPSDGNSARKLFLYGYPSFPRYAGGSFVFSNHNPNSVDARVHELLGG